MNWEQGHVGYYLDFVLVPLICAFTLLVSVFQYGASTGAAVATAAGIVAWTFAEYWIHRSLFHRVLRRAHWLHHKRPGGYIAAPAWVTAALHVAGCTFGLLSGPVGTGLFLGFEAGYFAYIATHDAIHHGQQRTAWIRNRAAMHDMHHRGAEKNFGVVTQVWDRVFRTYYKLPSGT